MTSPETSATDIFTAGRRAGSVQKGDDKLRFIAQFTRDDQDEKPLGAYAPLYMVTR